MCNLNIPYKSPQTVYIHLLAFSNLLVTISFFVNGIENLAVYGTYKQQKINWDFRGVSLELQHIFVYTKKIPKNTKEESA